MHSTFYDKSLKSTRTSVNSALFLIIGEAFYFESIVANIFMTQFQEIMNAQKVLSNHQLFIISLSIQSNVAWQMLYADALRPPITTIETEGAEQKHKLEITLSAVSCRNILNTVVANVL